MHYVRGSDARQDLPNKRRKTSPHPDFDSSTVKPGTDKMAAEHWRSDVALDPDADSDPTESMSARKTEYPSQVVRTSSREELMECIKRGQRPAWIPQPGFRALREEEEAMCALRKVKTKAQLELAESSQKSSLVSARDIVHSPAHASLTQYTAHPSGKEGPPSALHAGDFSTYREPPLSADSLTSSQFQPGSAITTSTTYPEFSSTWLAKSSAPSPVESTLDSRTLSHVNSTPVGRRRAPSLGSSLSSSFVLRAPTSPLVHATTNRDIDPFSQYGQRPNHAPRRDETRRRTMPPNSFHAHATAPFDLVPPNFSRPFAPALRREASLPSQAHQPRRSLSSFTYHPKSNPQSPIPRARRQSLTSDSSVRRRTSMVGSFEESLLRGRMSTPPSKPLDFVAQIGVMGKGECSAGLKCPAHVTVPFPAVFYSYPASTTTRSVSDDTPSPYVGTVNLRQHLKDVVLATKVSNRTSFSRAGTQPDLEDRSTEKSKINVGGAYRVPQQGQLQIIVKNPNKTAVKLFLIPYDLTGMEPKTKTFVRQRSFSTGAIVESVLSANQSKFVDPLENKQILRYLVHIKFCCPAKNRFYLHDDIRVVFANRVPDGKEKLRNELHLPTPRFSSWKPTSPDLITSHTPTTIPSTPTFADFDFESPRFFDDLDNYRLPASPTSSAAFIRPEFASLPPPGFAASTTGFQAESLGEEQNPRPGVGHLPFIFPDIRSRSPTTGAATPQALSPITGFGTANLPIGSGPIAWRSPVSVDNNSRRSFSPAPIEAGDGLLSRKFRELRAQNGDDNDILKTK